MKKTMKKRAFVSAIAMLVVSAIVLTSSTFAWFSMGKEASAGPFDLEVAAPEGIQISPNGSRFTSSIGYEEFAGTHLNPVANAYPGNTNVMTKMLNPVSGYSVAGGKLRLFKATIAEETNLSIYPSGYSIQSTSEANAADKEYLAFDLFFRVAKPTVITMKGTSIKDGSTLLENLADPTTAVRVALIYNQNYGATTTSLNEGQAATAAGSTLSYLYEPNALKHTEAGTAAGYVEGTAAQAQPLYFSTLPSSKYNLFGKVEGGGGVFPDGIGSKTVTTSKDANTITINLAQGITKYRVYIWMEGQDADCGNIVAGGNIKATLKFTMQ